MLIYNFNNQMSLTGIDDIDMYLIQFLEIESIQKVMVLSFVDILTI